MRNKSAITFLLCLLMAACSSNHSDSNRAEELEKQRRLSELQKQKDNKTEDDTEAQLSELEKAGLAPSQAKLPRPPDTLSKPPRA